MKKLKVKCMRCGEGMTVIQSFKQKMIYNRAFCIEPSISTSQIFCEKCLFQLYRHLVYSVVDFLNQSREMSQGLITEKGKKIQ